MTYRKKWLARAVLLLLAGLGAQQATPLLFRWSPIRRVLRSRLEYAFGRPVDVGSFAVSLSGGPRLEARFITVAEDPRFGQEFFLRAESLTAGLDWSALLRGRLRFARFTFTRPSLNVVVSADGAWNVETWLESRASAGNAAARGVASPERPRQIVVRAGRINFKRGPDKQPFALVNLDGTLAPGQDGMWSMEFEAHLLRAGVTLQESGSLRFRGQLPEAGVLPPALPAGAVPVNAPPAQFDLAWRQASLSDALRLFTGQDYGVRGSLEGNLSVRGPSAAAPSPPPESTAPPQGGAASLAAHGQPWSFRADLRLAGIHRWDLPLQPGHPAVNLAVEGAFSADRARWDFSKVTLEAPRSSLRASGLFSRDPAQETRFRFLSSSIHIDDLFAWYRAFHANVSSRVALDGYLGVDVELTGWPPRIERGVLATDGVRLTLPGVQDGFTLGSATLRVTPKGAELSPLTLTAGDAAGSFRLSAKTVPGAGTPWQAALIGDTPRIEDIFAAAAALGLTRPQGWRAEGALQARLRWQGTRSPWRAVPTGTLDLQDADFRNAVLALPVHLTHGRLEMTPLERRIRITAAQFLGAEWSGALSAKSLAGPWSFSLDADQLDTARFGAWFSSSAPQGPSGGARSGDERDALRLAWPESLAGKGQFTIGEIAVGRLHLGKFKATASIADRSVELSSAQAEFYGGRVRGTFHAGFQLEPRYQADAQFDSVNLASLLAPHPTLQGCCAGLGSGAMTVAANGVGREALLASLHGQGSAEIRAAQLRSMDLFSSISANAAQPGRTELQRASATFSIASQETSLEQVALFGPQGSVKGAGTVSFSGVLNLEFPLIDLLTPKSEDVFTTRVYRVTGTLVSPQLSSAAGKP